MKPDSSSRVRIKIGFLLAAIGTGLSLGCQNEGLSSIDRRVDDLIHVRSSQLGKDALPPDYRGVKEANESSDLSVTAKTPDSRNPDLNELHFDPRPPEAKDEANAVEQRLSEFQGLPSVAEGARLLALPDVLKQAQRTSREYITLEEDYILAAIQLLIERHLWSPRLFNDTSVIFDSEQVDGDSETALNVINELRATQRLPYGGEASARWIYNATENLRSAATGQYVQSSALVFDANIPLLRGAGLIAQEGLIQAERDLVYAARTFEDRRRDYFVSVSRDYFDLQQQKQGIDNTMLQLQGLQSQLDRVKALFEAGREPLYQVDLTENELLRSRASLATQRDTYVLTLDRFKLRLGLPVGDKIVIAERDDQADIPMPAVTLEEAVALALDYRLDLQNQRDQLDDRRRGVKNARNQLLPDLDLGGNVQFPTDADEREGGAVYEPDDVRYGASVTFGLPLDREVERLNLRRAQIGLEQAVRELDRFRDDVILTVRDRVRNIELSQFTLLLNVRQVEITERRKRQQEIRADEVTPREFLDTLTELLQAQNDRDQAETALRNSILDYLLATGQMRVDRDGTFRRLPGMETAGGLDTPR